MTHFFQESAQFTRWNEEMSRKYDSEDYHLRSNFFIRWIEKKRVRAVLSYINANENDTVLEAGCGAGVVLTQFPAGQLIGIDLSGYILQKARRRLANRAALLIQASVERLPLPNGRFPKLICTEVIEHVMNPTKLVGELARLATENAVIVITIPNEGLIDRLKSLIGKLGLGRWLLSGTSDQEAENRYNSPDGPNEWHLHHFNLPLLRQVLADSLYIQEVQAIPFRFLPIRYVVCCRPYPLNQKNT